MTAIAKVYVLDASVLLSAPRALTWFAEHEVVLPVAALLDLQSKQTHPELGHAARRALSIIDDIRTKHGDLTKGVTVNDKGGTFRVEQNHISFDNIPESLRVRNDNDFRILAVAHNLFHEDKGKAVTLVTKNVALRILAASIGLRAEEFEGEKVVVDEAYHGVAEIDVPKEAVDDLHTNKEVDASDFDDSLAHITTNSGVIMSSGQNAGLATMSANRTLKRIPDTISAFGMNPRSAEQKIALAHLLNPDVGVVSLGGQAGSGKTALALAAGLELVLERRKESGHEKVIIFRPLYAVGGQELGYLPGTEAEKMAPWGAAVFDALRSITTDAVIEEILHRGQLEVLPLTHIRGRSLHKAFVIVDEAQSLERSVITTALTRVGQDAKIVLTHDVSQRDNLHVGRFDGIAAVVESLKGERLFAHTTLRKSERSAVAEMATRCLDTGF